MKTRKQIMRHIGKWLMGSLMLGAVTLAGCSNEEEMVQTANGCKAPGTYTFRLGGAASGSAATRATMVAEDAEKEVKELYVALFTSDDKLYKVFGTATSFDTGKDDPATNVKITKEGDNYTITPYYAGQYTAYFIANPGTTLVSSIMSLTKENTLADFEALEVTEDADQTAGSSFVMSSGRQTIEISSDLPTTASEPIKLTRLVARFDIVDSQPGDGTSNNGAKITSVQLLQSASKSHIATPTAMPEGYVANAAVKDWGTPADNKLTLYTYENINTGTADDNAMVVRVKYELDGANKQLDITLKEEGVNLAVKRNNLYRINLNCAYGTYSLEVIDWTTGEVVNVHDGALDVTYTAADLGKIGDYVYNNNGKLEFSDGGLRKMKLNGVLEWATRPNPVTDKGTCIGIVFSNMTSEKDKAAGFKRGYVMALKNTSTGYFKFGNTNGVDAGLPKVTTLGAFIKDLDGYTYSQSLKGKGLTNYPACKSAMEYEVTLPTDTKTSGWYLPSIGQLSAIFYNFTELATLRNSQSSEKDMVYKSTGISFDSKKLALLNGILSPVGNGNYTPFSLNMNFTSSTEVSKDYIAYIYIGDGAFGYKDQLVICGWGVKTFQAYIRPVFAF